MNFKKIASLSLILVLGASLFAGCGSDSANSGTKKELTYSKSQGPYSELFEQGIKPILEKKGYKVTGKDMSDLLQADVALNEGEVDFNVEQHTAYMENFNEKQKPGRRCFNKHADKARAFSSNEKENAGIALLCRGFLTLFDGKEPL